MRLTAGSVEYHAHSGAPEGPQWGNDWKKG